MARVTAAFTLKINGIEEVLKSLEDLQDPKAMLRLLRAANKESLKIAKEEMIARAPEFKGNRAKTHPRRNFGPLKKSFAIVTPARMGNKTTVMVGPTQDGFYARFLEYGTGMRFVGRKLIRQAKKLAKRLLLIRLQLKGFRGYIKRDEHAFLAKAIDASTPRILSYIDNEYGNIITKKLKQRIRNQKKAAKAAGLA